MWQAPLGRRPSCLTMTKEWEGTRGSDRLNPPGGRGPNVGWMVLFVGAGLVPARLTRIMQEI